MLGGLIIIVFERMSEGLLMRINEHFQLTELAKQCENLGLTEIESDSSNYDYENIVVNSRRLVIVLNDGRTWASVHRDRLRRRFEDSSKQTTIFLCNPRSRMLHVLSRKGSVGVEDIQARVMQTVTLLDEIKKPTTSLEVLGHYLFNPYSLILGDDEAVIIPYFLSRGGRKSPLYKYSKSKDQNFFNDLEKDIEMLRKDAGNIISAKLDQAPEKTRNLRAV